MRHNADQFARDAARDGRIEAARNHHQQEFSRTAALSGRIDGRMQHELTAFSKAKPPGKSAAGMAPRSPLPPPLPERGFNHPRPATLRAPSHNPKLHPVANSGPFGQDPRASHLGRLDPRSGVFVGTGKWNGPDQPATTPANRTESLQPHEHQQTAYQMGVRLASLAPPRPGEPAIEPIEDPSDLAHLRTATQVMHETRTDLRFGRGNVGPDIRATKGESSARTDVSYQLLDANGPSVAAGTALAMGAGNCDQNGWINSRRYSEHLAPGETVDTVTNHTYHHTWSQINRPPERARDGSLEPRATIVVDSWADGPAVRLGDSAWARHAADSFAQERFDKTAGGQALQRMNQTREDALNPATQLNAYARSELAKGLQAPPKFVGFGSTPTVSNSLAERAQEEMLKHSPFTREVMAVAAARQAYGLNVARATHTDTTVGTLEAAMRLDRPSRPPIITSNGPASDDERG